MSVNEYGYIVSGSLHKFLELSAKIGDDVATQSAFVKKAFDAQFAFIQLAAESSKPDAAQFQTLLQPTAQQIQEIQSFREKKRTSKFFNHLSAVSESIPALGWVCVSPTPGPHVKEMNDAGQFYTNRVLKEWKEVDPTHVEWARAWISTLTELQAFIKQYHTTGLVWSGKKAPATAGGAPPPPPPPVLPPIADMSLDNGGKPDDRSQLFAEINKGASITDRLKHVSADMQTHKNTALRSGPAPFKAPSAANVKSVPSNAKSAPVDKPASTKVDGKKWYVEYYKNRPDNDPVVIDQAEMNNVIYIFKCVNTKVVVKGKVNSIVLDACEKSAVVFDSVVASVEFINCQSCGLQVSGQVPTISIDKSDGCDMYLSEKSKGVEIISSKSSAMNVVLVDANGDVKELPIPEQFKTTLGPKGLTTICVESLG